MNNSMAYAIGTVKELRNRIDELEAENKELREDNARLEKAVRFAHANSDVRLKDEWTDHMAALKQGKE